ncbi:hypothetical protein QYE76_018494 [Lolium multiflorum]|uniref:F-box domain-containing protein n=1 Tax=Lolium multiflorum TaxID=4521 RepID=A0AAD8QJ49_LOLMU|nr:hypothetical protein QYE76_018494 [Lolium multiflorum]
MPANANWISPLHMFNDDNAGHQKIMFGTGNRKVLAVDADGAGTVETIFRADDAITGSFAGCAHPSLGLFQESLVPVGRTVEEIVFSSPAKQAWFHILKWMPARSVADLSLVCREWRLGYNLETSKHLLVLTSYKGKNSSTLEYQIECNCKLRQRNSRFFKAHSAAIPSGLCLSSVYKVRFVWLART